MYKLLILCAAVQGNTDVLGCRVDGSTVDVLDTFNPDNPQPTSRNPNVRDGTDDGLCTHYAAFQNGRIRCQ